MIDQWWFLLALGFAVGTLGTLIGAGGGFILVPLLLFLMPGADPAQITAISLGVVFCNATSGTIAYARMGRVDWKSAAWFGLATLPGALLGPFVTKLFPRQPFGITFGALLIVASAYLVLKPETAPEIADEPSEKLTRRQIVDRSGKEHVYHVPMTLGMIMSVLVGFLANLLGIGGGIIHVPLLNRTLNFPVHIATATSHAILAFTALVGTGVHLADGSFENRIGTAALIGVGAVVGAQAGARLSNRVHGSGIIRALAIALGIVGARLLWVNLG